VIEFYLCKIHEFIAAQRCFSPSSIRLIRHYLGETASPLFDSIVTRRSAYGMTHAS
jgi:hypothetical protein